VIIEKMIVAGDYVTVHMKFTGHFTGSFGPGELTLAIANKEIVAAVPCLGLQTGPGCFRSRWPPRRSRCGS
jgi:hypothetical protein